MSHMEELKVKIRELERRQLKSRFPFICLIACPSLGLAVILGLVRGSLEVWQVILGVSMIAFLGMLGGFSLGLWYCNWSVWKEGVMSSSIHNLTQEEHSK